MLNFLFVIFFFMFRVLLISHLNNWCSYHLRGIWIFSIFPDFFFSLLHFIFLHFHHEFCIRHNQALSGIKYRLCGINQNLINKMKAFNYFLQFEIASEKWRILGYKQWVCVENIWILRQNFLQEILNLFIVYIDITKTVLQMYWTIFSCTLKDVLTS